MLIYLKIQRLITLRNIRRISCNKVVYKAWLNSLVGVEQVSSCRADFLVSAKKMQNLVCADWKCSCAEKIVGAEKSSDVEQWKCSWCRASIKFSGCRVNPQKVSSNIVYAEHQYFNNAKLLHYLKSQRFAISEPIRLLHWILWTKWKIRMTRWFPPLSVILKNF